MKRLLRLHELPLSAWLLAGCTPSSGTDGGVHVVDSGTEAAMAADAAADATSAWSCVASTPATALQLSNCDDFPSNFGMLYPPGISGCLNSYPAPV